MSSPKESPNITILKLLGINHKNITRAVMELLPGEVPKVPAVRGDGAGTDRINITTDRKLELPKPQMPADFFYLTDDGETTRNHPRQQALELREVSTPAKPAQFKEA